MKRKAAQRLCALVAALALSISVCAGAFAEAAPGAAASGPQSGTWQAQEEGQSSPGSEETADSALSHQPETPADESSLKEKETQAGQPAEDAAGQAGAEQEAAVQAAAVPQAASLAEATGLTITADDGQPLVEGVDYELTADTATNTGGKLVVLKTERAVTVTGTSKDNYGLQVAAGVHASITFNNVTIKAPIPFDIVTNLNGTADGTPATRGYEILPEKRTSVHLTLADGSVNTLTVTPANTERPALRCGEGSVLVIDDSVWNQTAAGEAITPEQGRVPYDCTLKNGTELKQGDPLWKMDSETPGALTVNGGYCSAGIGGGYREDSGKMTIEGGCLEVYATNPGNAYQNFSLGAGIGGGTGGGTGCTLEGSGLTINGGDIKAYGSYHGAGIGTGCVNGDGIHVHASALPGAISSRLGTCSLGHANEAPIPGDITINGGYSTAYGYTHGNAFGGGCLSAVNTGHGDATTPHEIKITGGTLKPVSLRTGKSYDVGALGGKVIVTGGSFPVGKYSGGVDGLSFQGASVESASGEKLTMVEIDLHNYPELQGGKVIDFHVSIGGVPLEPEYGLANIIDTDGKLYFWLPKSAVGQSVEISGLKVLNTSGQEQDGEYPFVVPEVGQNGNVAKRYVIFEVDESQFSEELSRQLNKRYDGVPVSWEKLKDEIAAQGIEVTKPNGEKLTDASAMTPEARRYLDKNGQPTQEASNTAPFKNAGSYELIINSSQFAKDEDFAATFWGHQAKLGAKITPADSRVTDFTYSTTGTNKTETLTLTANVKPQAGEALTCDAPDGYVQFYINGVAVGAPMELAKLLSQTDTDGYAYRTASVTLNFTQGGYPAIPSRPDGKFVIEAKHYGSTNYTDSEGTAIELDGADLPGGGLPTTDPPEVVIRPEQPGGGESGKPLEPDKVEPNPDGSGKLDSYIHDKLVRPTEPGAAFDKDDAKALINDRYVFKDNQGNLLTPGEVVIYDKDGNDITDQGIDLSKPGDYVIHVKVEDANNGNSTTVDLDYIVKDPPEVSIKPGQPGEPEKDGNGEDKPGTGTLQPEDKPHQGEDGLVHQNYKDVVYEKVENVTLTQAEVEELVNGRYNIPAGSNVSVVIKDSTGKEVTGLDKSRVTHYTIEVVVTDAEGNSTTVHLRYQLYEEGTTPPAPGGSGEKGNPKTSV